eukprot:scaffold26906_cov32-Tisochrysis_lutea.AAC.3
MHGIRVAPPTSKMREIGLDTGLATSLLWLARSTARCHRQATADAHDRVRSAANDGLPLARVPMSDSRVIPKTMGRVARSRLISSRFGDTA